MGTWLAKIMPLGMFYASLNLVLMFTVVVTCILIIMGTSYYFWFTHTHSNWKHHLTFEACQGSILQDVADTSKLSDKELERLHLSSVSQVPLEGICITSDAELDAYTEWFRIVRTRSVIFTAVCILIGAGALVFLLMHPGMTIVV